MYDLYNYHTFKIQISLTFFAFSLYSKKEKKSYIQIVERQGVSDPVFECRQKGREIMKAEKDVQPIRNQQQLDDMKWALKRHCSERDYILFILGCETGLRVGDLLRLPTQQIITLKGKQNKILRVKEGKTQKIRDIYIANCFQEVYEYAKNVQSASVYSRLVKVTTLLPLLRRTDS